MAALLLGNAAGGRQLIHRTGIICSASICRPVEIAGAERNQIA